jgi:hypothetical protein
MRGGDEGRTLVSEAEAWGKSEGVADLGRLAAVITPGLGKGR